MNRSSLPNPVNKAQVDVHGLARLPPTLHCKSANETESPVVSDAERLEFGGSADDFIHDEHPPAYAVGIGGKLS